jgi:hypothetical protein
VIVSVILLTPTRAVICHLDTGLVTVDIWEDPDGAQPDVPAFASSLAYGSEFVLPESHVFKMVSVVTQHKTDEGVVFDVVFVDAICTIFVPDESSMMEIRQECPAQEGVGVAWTMTSGAQRMWHLIGAQDRPELHV